MGGKGTAQDPALEASQVQNSTALTSLAQTQGANSNQLFQASFPGFQTAENAASVLSSGDPDAISKLIAPAAQQIQTATAGAKQNILNTAPAGGAKDLAIENADVQQGGQIGALASQGYNQSFNQLAQLAGQGGSQSNAAAGTAISGFNSSNSGLGSVVNENIAQKGATLGGFGSLLGAGATVAAAYA